MFSLYRTEDAPFSDPNQSNSCWTELQSNRSETKANKGIVWNNDIIVDKGHEVVNNTTDVVQVSEESEFGKPQPKMCSN